MHIKPYPDEIAGEQVILKTLSATPENATDLHRLIKKNAQCLGPYLRGDVESCKNVQMTLKLLHRMHQLRQQEDTLLYHVFYQGEMVGAIEALIYPRERELRYWLDNEAKGKGLMYESVCLMEKMLFERNQDRIILSISDKNMPSLNLAKRLGYVMDDTDYYEMTYNRYKQLRGLNQNLHVIDVVGKNNQR